MNQIKSWIPLLALISIVLVLSACGQNEKKHEVTLYSDFKCPYCKKFEEKVMPKLDKDYIQKDKINFTFVNAAFLGDDSKIGAAASHAVKDVAPNKYIEFNNTLFKNQKSESQEWLTNNLVDNEIDKLGLSKNDSNKIKKEYKNKDSKAWKEMEKDQKRLKEDNIEEVPTLKIDGKKVNDVYDYDAIKKKLDE
ncbi:DsbA family protein [Staphylococcus chromogenes]|uniref:DsbA family protein n=1 Tax=Staphylococcus chromogenes TaxID=46126 RepID=UPI00288687BF|nr:thioredoxin domain-containing protein [Staphylococcus chromogenes]MDT0700418.1 thioredoxin domain-containing protein [Staphylococcus chromogenes]